MNAGLPRLIPPGQLFLPGDAVKALDSQYPSGIEQGQAEFSIRYILIPHMNY